MVKIPLLFNKEVFNVGDDIFFEIVFWLIVELNKLFVFF